MQQSVERCSMNPQHNRTATRFSVNRNWSYRGDNTKYKGKK